MYEKDFKRNINKLPNAFMLYGACRLNLFFSLEIIKDNDKSDEILTLRDSDYKLEKAINYLGTNSLFSNTKTLIIEVEKAISKKDLSEIIKLVDNDNKLILVIYSESALKDLEKVMNNNFVRFFEKKLAFEQIALLKEMANFYNINISEDAILYLQKNYEFDIFKAGCELLKYKNQNINLNLIKEHLDGDLTLSYDDFLNNFLNTNEPNIFIYKILENEDEIALINKFYSSFLRLFKISASIKINANIDYKVTLGYTPPVNICKELEKQARKVGKFYEEIFDLLLNADYEIKKNSNNNAKEILYSSLLKIYFLINS